MMKPKSYLLRIELLYAHRPIWREVWVPSNITLDFLHDVIQEAMGWDDAHMHCFEFQKRRIESMQFMDGLDDDSEDEEAVQLSDLLKRARQKLRYIYDFGDEWIHSVTLKKQVSALPDEELFVCVAGESACPMEDCGGTYGHERICEYVKTGVDDGFMPYEEWGVKEYDPDAFDIDSVNEDLSMMVDEEDEVLSDLDALFEEDAVDDLLPGFGGNNGFLPGFAEDEEEDDEVPDPYLGLTQAGREQFRETMDLGKQVRALQPWKDLWDQDIFCIKDPDTGLLDFVSVLGRGGEVFALHVHYGFEALQFWKQTILGTLPQDPEVFMRSLRMTEIEFLNKGQMEPEDLSLYQITYSIRPDRGRQLWMRFRRYHPRAGAPWFPDAEELPRLRRAMRLCERYIELLRAEPKATRCKYERQDDRDTNLPEVLPCFTLTKKRPSQRALAGKDLASWEFSQAPVDWESANEAVVAFEPSEFEVQRIANLPVVHEAWEVGAIYLSAPVGTEDGPVVPLLAVTAPLAEMDQPPLPHVVADLETSPAQAVWDCVVAEALRRGVRPAELHVTTPLAYEAFQGLAAISSTDVVHQPEFQQLHELLNVMSRM